MNHGVGLQKAIENVERLAKEITDLELQDILPYDKMDFFIPKKIDLEVQGVLF